jgi:hypothetical protein
MLRIGLSGTNWTRKTTTIQQVARALDPVPVDIVSLSSFVQQCPFPMGPVQTLDGSKWMVDQVAQILARPIPAGTVQIFDRTPLDILAFTLLRPRTRLDTFSSFRRTIATSDASTRMSVSSRTMRESDTTQGKDLRGCVTWRGKLSLCREIVF